MFFVLLPHFVVNIKIRAKQPITLRHKTVLSPFQGNQLEMCSTFLTSRLLVWPNRLGVSTWAIVFFSFSPHWAKPPSPCNLRGRACNLTYSNGLGWAGYRERPGALCSQVPTLQLSRYPKHSCPLPRFPHTAWLQHLQAPPRWWRLQDCSLRRERLKYCFYRGWRMRGNRWMLVSLNHSIFSGLPYY